MRLVSIFILCLFSEKAIARCTDSNFLRRAVAYNHYNYIKVKYLDSLGKSHTGIVQNVYLFEHLFKNHAYYYNKYRPFLINVLKQDIPIPYALAKNAPIIETTPNTMLDELSKENVGKLLEIFDSYKWSGSYKKDGRYWNKDDPFNIAQVVAYLFDAGILVKRYEEYWHIGSPYACGDVLVKNLRINKQ